MMKLSVLLTTILGLVVSKTMISPEVRHVFLSRVRSRIEGSNDERPSLFFVNFLSEYLHFAHGDDFHFFGGTVVEW
jgi:hypothetical protein